jgi:hypothetical protein
VSWRLRLRNTGGVERPRPSAQPPTRDLDRTGHRSLYVLMVVETLKDALSAGWRVHARCIDGHVEYTRSKAKCRYQAELIT